MEKKFVGDNPPGAVSLLNALALVLEDRGKLAEAETLFREALATERKQLGNEHPDVARFLDNLGGVLQQQGKLAEAETTRREALAIERKQLGNEHPGVAKSLDNLGGVLREEGKLAEAEPLLREALAMERKLLGNEHPVLAYSINNLGGVLQEQGKLAEAETLFREALAMKRKLLGNEHPRVASSLSNLADVQARQGKWKAAEDRYATLIQRDPTNHLYHHRLATVLAADGDLDRYQSCCKAIVARFGNTTDPFVGDRMAKDCSILPSSGADGELVGKMADAAVAAGPTNLYLAYFQCSKGMAEYRLGHFSDALNWLDNSIAILKHPGNYYSEDALYVEAYAVSAMAHSQLKQAGVARAALASAKERAEAKLPKLESGDLGGGWVDCVIAHKLLDEATGLIGGGL